MCFSEIDMIIDVPTHAILNPPNDFRVGVFVSDNGARDLAVHVGSKKMKPDLDLNF
jgi:hypothetical protein